MDAPVVKGPWTASPVVQPLGPIPKDAWWVRGPGGELIIVDDGQVVTFAPVREAKISPHHPQPNRAPFPQRITEALDMRGMEGPEVDEALGVTEPTVDQWESGDLVPSSADVRRLATLTQFAVGFFYREPREITGPIFICPPPEMTRNLCDVCGGPTDIHETEGET